MDDKLANQLKRCVSTCCVKKNVALRFKKRISNGKLTREENATSHFGVFFVGYDILVKKVFIGHHRKSDLWIPHGGHIDKDELLLETLLREIDEKWGVQVSNVKSMMPELLTITEIENKRQKCKRHYDIWYFVKLDQETFDYDKEKIHEEFHCVRWCSIKEAKKLVVAPSVVEALDYLGEKLAEQERD